MKEEMVDIVNDNNEIIDTVPRSVMDKKILRSRVSRIIIMNSKKQILLQKRASTKKRFPDHWDLGVAETIQAGESYDNGAIRGMKEELGINAKKELKLLFKIKYDDEVTKRFYNVYSFIYDDKIRIDETEVSEIKFVTKKELEKMIKTEKFIPASIAMYKKYSEEYNDN